MRASRSLTLSSCNYTECNPSRNHLLLHLGVGVKYYLTTHVFVRPECHFYFVKNPIDAERTTAERIGISIGYTFGNR